MLPSFLLLPLSVIPVIVPLRAQLGEIIVPSSYVQVAKVPLPQLSSQQWEMLRQQQGADRKPLRLYVALSVYQGQVYGVHVLRGTRYPDIDSTIVNWIAANWKTALWFGVGTENAVSFDIDPTLRQVRFQTGAS
jgi:hypothetical protein